MVGGQSMNRRLRRVLLSSALSLLTLSFTLSANAGIDWAGPEVPAEGLRIGSELLEWGSKDGIPTLMRKGQPVVSSTNGYAKPPFTVLDTWSTPETSAVLLQAGTAATRDCSVIHVVESRPPDLVAAHELGTICVAFDMPEVVRNAEGFLFSHPPSPTQGTSARQWHAGSGTVTTSRVEFRPEPNSTMQELVARDHPERTEPLQNEEFFTAVARLPVLQRDRTLSALWLITKDCCDWAMRSPYGVAMDGRTAAYAGCGQYMVGARVSCKDSDALAVWDRQRGAFYFATDEHRLDGRHDDPAALTVWPPLAEWSPAARERFDAWTDGRALLTTNSK